MVLDRWALVCALVGGMVSGVLRADVVGVEVKTAEVGLAVPAGMVGLSYETSRMLADEKGERYFRPGNTALVGMFKTLGVRNLRVGGDSVDTAEVATPGEEDMRSLFEFAQAAGVKVIYSVRLREGEPAAAAKQVKFIEGHFPGMVETYAIGNEPKYYEKWEEYEPRWVAIRDAMVKEAPGARFCGPDTNPAPALVKRVVEAFGGEKGKLVEIAQHNYPFGCAYRNYQETDVTKLIKRDVPQALDRMLSPQAYTVYEPIRKGMADAVAGTGMTFRLSETNSYWFSGLEGASDRYAAALWGVDYLYWWASHGAAGINFHTGDRTGGRITLPCRYAAFVTTDGGYEARPLAYGMKLFSVGGRGKVVPAKVSGEGVMAYAAVDGEEVLVTVINKRHGAGAEGAEVRVMLDVAVGRADGLFLREKTGDVGAEAGGVTLGGGHIAKDGRWEGKWEAVKVEGREVVVKVGAAEAVVVRGGIQNQ